MSTDWENKIVAFLYPPYAALLEENKIEGEWKGLIKQALGSKEIPDEVRKAQKFAKGLDIPSFVRQNINKPDLKSSSVFKHPLSGRNPLKAPSIPKLDKLKKEVQDIIDEVKKEFGSDSKKFYLALWRLLPKELVKNDSIWTFMPADPRVPCYPWWIYNSIASAFVSTFPKPALLQFTIASPQEFIPDARRTQDFWMASYLYSYLSWTAIRHIIDKCGPDCIIFPNLYEQPMVNWLLYKECGINELKPEFAKLKLANITNLSTVIIPEEEAKELAKGAMDEIDKKKKEIARYVKEYIRVAISEESKLDEKIRETLKSIKNRQRAESIEKWLNAKLKGDISCEPKWKEIWERQVEDWLKLELFWVVYPWPTDKDFEPIKEEYHQVMGYEVVPESSTEQLDARDFKKAFEQNKNYGTLYQIFTGLVDRSLTTRKNLRDFCQTKEEEHKCSLCGKREALHPEWMEKEGDHYPELRVLWDVLRRISNDRKLAGRIRRGERLCAVCLTKRLTWEAYFIEEFKEITPKGRVPAHITFPSTASIATAKFKLRVIKKVSELQRELKNYVKATKRLLGKYDILYPSGDIPNLEEKANELNDKFREIVDGFLWIDGDWLYPESFDKERIEREYGVKVSNEELQKVRETVEALLNKAKELGIGAPSRYFAIIAMDIDKMGDWLKGKRAPKLRGILHEETVRELEKDAKGRRMLQKRRPIGAVSHTAFSNAVKNFGLYVIPQVIEEERCGKIIYAGGDDSLALVSVEDLLGAISALHEGFMGDEKTGFGKDDNKMVPGGVPDEGDRVTISAGAAIVHYTHPLSHAVEETWKAEDKAKDEIGRNAFVIHLLRRAGEPTVARAKWEFEDFDMIKELKFVKKSLEEEGKLSSRLIYDMHEEKQGLRLSDKDLNTEALASLFKRLLERHADKNKLTEEKNSFEKLPSWFEAISNDIKNSCKEIENERRGIGDSTIRKDEYEALQEYKENMWEEVCNLLTLARFIAQKAQEG